ncbi:MAG: radical SAM family heme chaperone HemW [Lentimicrobiaceae bacterium]|nr:radical SAM family heme chaperone HemW [Lentimicrobiaceae bacterium]
MSGIYIHIPFCKKKCIYCSFYSVVCTKEMGRYVEAVVQELQKAERKKEKKEGRKEIVETVYFGGGTPSLLPIHDLEKILNAIHDNFNVADEVECTIEGNPEQLSFDYLKDLKKIGFNRISIGIQSFNDEILHFLGRIHSGKDTVFAVENAQKAGFENISIDLIYGIYLRSMPHWMQELKTAFQLPIKHLSAYSLTVEENTLLHKKISQQKMQNIDEDQVVMEMNALIEEAEKNDFEHYEVSNFALKNYHSKHNSNYWNGTPYLGFGASAHSFSGNTRSWNIANVEKYKQAIEKNIPCFEVEYLNPVEQYNEYVLLRLRTKNGIDLKEVEDCFGKDKRDYLLHAIQKINPQYYNYQSHYITVTRIGLPLLDFITETLLFD